MNILDSQKTRILQDSSNYITKLKPNKKFYYLVLRILFPVVIITGSRMYLGPITHARGRMDVTLSFATMLLIILLIESLFAVVPRRKRLSAL